MSRPMLVFVCFPTLVFTQSSKTPLFVGSMAPLSGSRSWWGSGITVAMEMAFEYINNRTDILPAYELKLLKNDTRGETGEGNKILFDYINNRRPSLVLGPGRSNVALSVAETAKYWRMIQISASAESGYLSDFKTFPYFFRTISSISSSKATFVALAKKLGWSSVSILFYSRDMYAKAALDLKEECENNNITVLSYGSFLDRNDADKQLKHLKDIDTRIVFAFLQKTTSVMCLIYKHELFGNKMGWVIHTPDSPSWWKRTYKSLDCSPEQIRKAAEYAISIDHLYASRDKLTTISGLTPQQFWKAYEIYVNASNSKQSMYGPFGFDVAWLAALALNSSLTFLIDAQRYSLLDLEVENFTDVIKEHILQTRFRGVTGEVCLDENGDRSGKFEIFQLRGNTLELIAFHDATKLDNLSYYGTMKLEWRGGKPPLDHVEYKELLVEVSQVTFIVICVVASLGIILCFGFLFFNVVNRKKRFIKMSSPNINNAIIVGCLLAYVSVILFSLDGETLTSFLCKAKIFTLDIGFTIAFGSMFSKTWRVHRITRKIRANRKVIRDFHLFGLIFVFLVVDLIIFTVWTTVDPLQKNKQHLPNELSEDGTDVVYKPTIYYCATNQPFVWLLLIYGFKALLLVLGLFLAWETRKVKIPALNDSRHIGLAVYNVFTICTIGVPVITFTNAQPNEVSVIITSACVIFCTTLTLCLVFVPKITGLSQRKADETVNGHRAPLEYSSRPSHKRYRTKENCEIEVERLKMLLEKANKEKDVLATRLSHLEPKPSYML